MKPAAVLLVSSLVLMSSAVTTAGDAPAWEARANELVKPLIGPKLRNVVVGVIDATGKRHYLTFGEVPKGLSRLDEKTIFEIGSVTKVFTCLALADAVVKGELKLDDPVQPLLPASLQVPRRDETPITLEELATHSSGLPRLSNNLARSRGFDAGNPYARYDEALLADALKSIRIRDEKPRPVYSNLGVGLLGYALARHAGKSYESMMTERVLTPLKLNSTTTVVSGGDRERLVSGFSGANRPAKSWDFHDTYAGAGALRSDAEDMLTFLEFQMGRRETPLRRAMDLTHQPRREMSSQMSVGLGWMTFPAGEAKRRVWWHNGGTGGYCSFAAFCKDPGVGVVLLSNRANPPETDKIGLRLIELLAGGK